MSRADKLRFTCSENESVSSLLLFFGYLLEEGEDDGDSEHDTSTRSDGSHEVSKDAKSTNADSSKGSSDVDVASKVSNHGLLAHSLNRHVVLQEVGDNIPWRRSADINPYAREEGAGAHDKGGIEERVEGISLDVEPVPWGRDVVGETSNGGGVAGHVKLLPLSEEADEEVALELAVEHLGEEVEVGDEGGLEDDWNVGGVEELDGEWLGDATHLPVLES